MQCKGLLKRFAPFFIALALGLFVASFFVTVALPNVRFNRNHGNRHQRYHRQMEFENQRLREENLRLKKTIESISETKDIEVRYERTINDLVPPPPPLAPLPPRIAPSQR